MQIVINITLETIKNTLALIGGLFILFFGGWGISSLMRKIKYFKSKVDLKADKNKK